MTIPADPRAAISETDLLRELAVVLYEREKLSLSHAARLARMDKTAFNRLLAERRVPMHYDVADLGRDVAALRSLLAR